MSKNIFKYILYSILVPLTFIPSSIFMSVLFLLIFISVLFLVILIRQHNLNKIRM